MVNFSTPPALEGLLDLDRKGVDIRPTLLRVLTDQYLLSPTHTPDEERHYTELAMRLIDETDIPTRASIAARLAPCAAAPRSIMLQLARDMLDIAEPVLRHWPGLTPLDCAAIAEERGPLYADIMAQRGAKPEPADAPPPVRVLPSPPLVPQQPRSETKATAESKSKPEIEAKAEAGVESEIEAEAETRARDALGIRRPAINPDVDAVELCELFFAAGGAERRLILIGLDCTTWQPATPTAPMQRADVWRLETAALKRNTAAIVQELELSLAVSRRQARRMVEDELGEPIVIAAKAMDVPADVLQRIILFMNPRVGQSVDRVYELVELYSEISVAAACRMVAILGAADVVAPAPQTDWHSAAETARRALSEISTRPSIKRDTLNLQRGAAVARFGNR